MSHHAPRLTAIQWTLFLAFLLVVGRSAQVQLLQGDELRARAEASRTARVVLPARRGGIFDRHRTPLAQTFERFHVGVAPRELSDRGEAVELLSRHLDLRERDVRKRFDRSTWAYFHGPFSGAQVEALRRTRGVYLESTLSRSYPSRGLVGAIVGRPETDGRLATGLERQLDSLLRGTVGEAVVLKDAAGQSYESPSRLVANPIPGMDVYLTIDAELQDIARQALRVALRDTRASLGTVVAVEPRTGDILAALTLTSRGQQTLGVFTDAYEPGSIAKLFTASALLEFGRVRPHESVSGEGGRWNLGFRTISDVEPKPRFTLAEAVRYSSNIGISKFAERLSPEEQYETLRRFGFGTFSGVDVPGEAAGQLPAPHQWSAASPQSLAMGYEFSATPLQIAAAYAAIAADGLLMEPHLIYEIRSPDQGVIYRRKPLGVRQAVLPDVAAQLRALLESTVEDGTASQVSLSRFSVGGKTGTAQRTVSGRYQPGAYNATFISLFPADRPQLVTVVMLRDPQGEYHAGKTAAPVARALIEQVLSTDRVVIDRAAFTEQGQAENGDVHFPQGETRSVLNWPITAESTPAPALQAVPDVTGSSLRDAVRSLHRRGFKVRIRGWGVAVRTTPEAGTEVPTGTAVTVHAGDR